MAPPQTFPFLGMRGTGDWVEDQRPKNWRDTILRLYPNGSVPLTAMMARLSSESTDDPEYNWWTKDLPAEYAQVTGVYTNQGLSSEYDAGARAKGERLWLKMSEIGSRQYRAGFVARLSSDADSTIGVAATVLKSVQNGADSYLEVRLMQDDTDGDFRTAEDKSVIGIGSTHAEGAFTPESITYNPVKFHNYTQILRTTYDLTRTAKKTRLRTGDPFAEKRRENLELHGIQIEKAFLFGVRDEWIGDNGKPERATGGLEWFIKEHVPENVMDYTQDTGFAGKEWDHATGGKYWLDESLERLFRYGGDSRVAFAGGGAILGINRLAETFGTINMQTRDAAYGIAVLEWITPFGTLYLKRHPLFNLYPSMRHSMMLFEAENLKERYIDQTTLFKDKDEKSGGFNKYDGTKEEYLTETGLEFHHPKTAALFHNVGLDNELTP